MKTFDKMAPSLLKIYRHCGLRAVVELSVYGSEIAAQGYEVFPEVKAGAALRVACSIVSDMHRVSLSDVWAIKGFHKADEHRHKVLSLVRIRP